MCVCCLNSKIINFFPEFFISKVQMSWKRIRKWSYTHAFISFWPILIYIVFFSLSHTHALWFYISCHTSLDGEFFVVHSNNFRYIEEVLISRLFALSLSSRTNKPLHVRRAITMNRTKKKRDKKTHTFTSSSNIKKRTRRKK